MRKLFFTFYAIILFFSFNGCLVGGKFSSPEVKVDTIYRNNTASDTTELIKWFELYEDSVLVQLIRVALDSNKNLLSATARIEEARERAGIIKSNYYPQVSYSAGASASSVGVKAQETGAGIDGNSFAMYGMLNWELDLFGKIRHANKSAQATYMSEIENRNGVLISLIAQTAELYFILRDLDNRLSIAERTLVSRKENTRLITARFNQGYVPELDKLQAEQQEAVVAASIPDLKRQIIEVENSLRVLTGQNPGTIVRGLTNDEQKFNAEIPVGLPSALLQRRPDIRSVEKRVEAQFNRVGVTKANMFPTISLTGLMGFASPQLSTMLTSDGFVASGAGSIFGPIFEFNKNKSRKQAEEYRLQQLTYEYEDIVLSAFADVDNSLYGYRSYTEQFDILNRQVQAATKALQLTQARYDYGYTSYLEVIIQEDNLLEAENLRSFVLQKKLTSVVNLYKSLGGGW
jgi:multidrug efflux system outer membrane protein